MHSNMIILLLFQGNITKCIDPNRCYNEPSVLPNDFTVEYDLTMDTSDAVNTTINYKCRKESKNLPNYFKIYICLSLHHPLVPITLQCIIMAIASEAPPLCCEAELSVNPKQYVNTVPFI